MTRIKNIIYFESNEGFGRTDLMRAIKYILGADEGGTVYLYQQTPRVMLVKEKNGMWRVQIGKDKKGNFEISYAEIDKKEFSPTEAITRFTDNHQYKLAPILILKEESKGTSHFLKIIKREEDTLIEFDSIES